MPSPTMPTENLLMTMGEQKTFGIDFQDEGAVKDGQTLSTPVFHISGGGATVVTLAVLTAIFHDTGKGKSIPSGAGVRVKLNPVAPGAYNVACRVTTSGGDVLEVLGRLTITDTVP